MKHLCLILSLVLPSVAMAQGAPVEQGPRNVPEFEPAFPLQTRAPERISGYRLESQVFAGDLEHPWGIAPLPDGSFLVTERPGRMRLIGADGRKSAPLTGLPEIFVAGQGGLLDVAIDPGFSGNNRVYFSYAKPMGRGLSATALAVGTLTADRGALTGVRDLFVQSPPSPTAAHYGSRIVFDGSGHLFLTTGEHSSRAERVLAQDTSTTYGQVIRLTTDGAVPPGNPFDSPTWSYGHRNLQGAAIEPATGRLWTVEHGPKGGDELNHPEPGKNYGWPVISYGENYNGTSVGRGVTASPGMEQPVYYWDPVIAPAGMAFYQGAMFDDWAGDLLISSLNPGGLVRVRIRNNRVEEEERFLRGTRIRDVEVLSDGSLLVLVDQRRGSILRLTPAK